MKNLKFNSLFLKRSFIVLVIFILKQNLNAQTVDQSGRILPVTITKACEEKITVALDAACTYALIGSDLGTTARTDLMIRKLTTAGAQDYVAGYNNGVYTGSSIIFGRNDIGKEFEIMSGTSSNMCFHYVTIIDRIAPSGTAPASSIKCTDLINGNIPTPSVLGSWQGASGLGQVLNPIAGSIKWTATDCSNFTQSYEDTYSSTTPCAANGIYQTVTRRWKLADIYGNFKYIDQIITVRVPTITITPSVDVLNCATGAGSAGMPVLTWGGGIADQTFTAADFGRDFCGISVQLMSETSMDLCKGSSMIMRSYKVNRCNTFTTENQTVNILDRTTPLVNFSFNDFLRQEETQCFNMNGMQLTEFVYKTVITPINLNFGNSNAGAVAANANTTNNASIKITPLVSSIACNQASIEVNYTVSDPNCSAAKGGRLFLSSDNAAIKFSVIGSSLSNSMIVDNGTTVKITGTFSNTPGSPDPVVVITATDDCGNKTEVKLTIVIYDNVSPTSICENKQVTLTNNGEAVVFPSTFSQQTYDNCQLGGIAVPPATTTIRQLIRLTGTTCWAERLLFDCNTVNGKVDIRTIDGCGNYSDCCRDFTIANKPGPTCISSADVTTVCTDSQLSNINSLFTQPSSYINCGTISVVSPTPILITDPNCPAIGSAEKTWTFTGNGQSVTCSQKLIVTKVSGYRVKPLIDEMVTCGGFVYNEEAERTKALALVQFLDGSGALTCTAPLVNIQTELKGSSPACKVLRIRYTFYDKCLSVCTPPESAVGYQNFGQNGIYSNYTIKDNGYYQATTCTNGGIVFGYERYIMSNDGRAPTSTPPTNIIVSFPNDRCNFDFPSIPLTGIDLCNDGSITGSNLFISWDVVSPQGNTIASGNGTTTSATGITISSSALNNLAGGTYTVNYRISDFCGNSSSYSFSVTGKDNQTPFLLVHVKNAVLGSVSGTVGSAVKVIVDDVLNNLGDNCTLYGDLLLNTRLQKVREAGTTIVNPAIYTDPSVKPELIFVCSEIGLNQIRVWTKDLAGNTNFVLDTIYVQYNGGSTPCTNTPLSTITGTLKTETNQPVKDVVISGLINGLLVGNNSTDVTGGFSLKTPLGQNVQLKATKATTEDKYQGVTTFDIARISKHMLDLERFSSPYSIIAADVNKDGSVDASDMLLIRNLILRKSQNLPAGVWRFVDRSYKFINPENPFAEDFSETVNISNVPNNAVVNFIALKYGDVNTTYVANLNGVQVRNNKTLILQAEDMQLVAGNEYTVNITADNFNASAFQGTFSMNGATIKAVKAGDLANYSDGNFGLFTNEITTSWNGTPKLNAHIMSITFIANKTAKLSEILTVGNSLTPAIANDIQGNEMNINLKFTTGKIVGSEFALYQNTPNPVALETTITFNLPQDAPARLIIYSVDGKTILSKQVDGKAGLNQVSINKSELKTNGILYYRLETAEHTATKKMVILD
jgi:Dockerin type I domain